tara:strand:- start:82 stop:408 length:327 start_codon:yes stop_codon:yes gene_type:complete
MDADLVLKIVQIYLQKLEECSVSLTDLSVLPSSKETIKSAIKTMWFATDNKEIRNNLKNAYIRLADFQPGVSKGSVTIKTESNLDALQRTELEFLKKEVLLWEQDEFE